MQSIDEAEAAPRDCGGGKQWAIDCCSAVHGRWAELPDWHGTRGQAQLRSDPTSTPAALQFGAVPRRAPLSDRTTYSASDDLKRKPQSISA